MIDNNVLVLSENLSSLIDNIFVRNVISYSSGIFAVELTDHYLVFTFLNNIFARPSNGGIIEYRLINTILLVNFINSLSFYNFDDIVNAHDIDFAIEILNKIILKEYNLHCPVISRKKTKKYREKPWITNHLKSLVRYRQNSYYRYKSGHVSHKEFKSSEIK